jgi:hypothetical protein
MTVVSRFLNAPVFNLCGEERDTLGIRNGKCTPILHGGLQSLLDGGVVASGVQNTNA